MEKETLLYQQCIAGEPKAQEALFNLYAPKMLGVCFRYTRSIMEAEDVLQEGFIKVFKYLNSFKNEGSLEGWIRKIMVNTSLNHIKKNKHIAEELEIEKAIGLEADHDTAIQNYDSKLIMEALQALPDGYRVILNLFAIEGYSHKEIADSLGIAESTSRSQFLRAKVVLKRILEEKHIKI